jgi:hypothetical protein
MTFPSPVPLTNLIKNLIPVHAELTSDMGITRNQNSCLSSPSEQQHRQPVSSNAVSCLMQGWNNLNVA